jgi:hypothetical protein
VSAVNGHVPDTDRPVAAAVAATWLRGRARAVRPVGTGRNKNAVPANAAATGTTRNTPADGRGDRNNPRKFLLGAGPRALEMCWSFGQLTAPRPGRTAQRRSVLALPSQRRAAAAVAGSVDLADDGSLGPVHYLATDGSTANAATDGPHADRLRCNNDSAAEPDSTIAHSP